MASAPAFSMRRASSAKRPKSPDRMEGQTWMGRSCMLCPCYRPGNDFATMSRERRLFPYNTAKRVRNNKRMPLVILGLQIRSCKLQVTHLKYKAPHAMECEF